MQVVSLWRSHLELLLASVWVELSAQPSSTQRAAKHLLPGMGQLTLHPDLRLEVWQEAEASTTLHGLRQTWEPEGAWPLLVHIYHCLAMLHMLTREHDKVGCVCAHACNLERSTVMIFTPSLPPHLIPVSCV